MIDRIIAFSVGNKLVVGLMVLLTAVFGVYSASQLPVDAVPDITNNQVLVITVSPSLAAPEVERLITTPAERVMASLPKLKEMRSLSRFGLSSVTLVFEDGVDVYLARQMVSERLAQFKSQIPTGLGEPEIGPVSTGLGEVYQYYVVPKEGYENRYSSTQLRTLQEWIVRRQLLGVPGVADVSSLGGHLKQYQITIDPNRLKSQGVTMDELFNAVRDNNENTGGAYIEKGPNAFYIRSEGMAASTDDILNFPVKTVNHVPLLIRDIATVKEGSALRFGAMYNNKYGDVSGAVVLMLKGANAMEVVKQVKARVEEIKKRLPEGVTIIPYYERSKMVGHAISTVKKNLIEGALIVILVLVVFLGNLRSGLVVASVIPLSMLFALILMHAFGVSANLMSLGALDFGLIVDGAVIIVEGVLHHFHERMQTQEATEISKEEMNEEVTTSAGRLMNAAIFGQIIILIVYLPILSLEGIEGKMFKPMALTVAFALLGAFLLSLTYVPMMTALTTSRKISGKKSFADRMMDFLQKHYSRLLDKALHFPKWVLIIAVAAFAGAFLLFRTLGGEFIPQLEEGDFAIDARFLPGTSLSQTIKGFKMASEELKKFPEVQQVTCRIGSAEIPTDPMALEQGDIFVTLDDKSDWKTADSYNALADSFSKKLTAIPGLNMGFEYPVQMRFNELISGAKQDVVVKIFGDDLNQLSKLATQMTSIVRKTKGAADVYAERVNGLPQLVVKYNRNALARYGISISQVNHVLNAAFAGEKAGNMYDGERQFDVVLRLSDASRNSPETLDNLQISTPTGMQIPLSQLAEISLKDGPNQIQRENGLRRISVSFNVRGRDVQSVVTDLQQQVSSRIKMPSGYYAEYGGQFENLHSAKKRLGVAVPVSLFLILILLYFAFGQVKEALIVFSAIPLAAIGGIIALWLRQMPFSISAGIGFIALFGVAVLNGIVLISEFNRLKNEGVDDTNERIRQGTGKRLRPVLMTATVASLGFLPMAISSSAGAEVQRPLATVVIGGLVTATLLTLFVLPASYKVFAVKKGIKPATKTLAILLFLSALFIGQKTQAQEKRITVDEALKMAVANNLTVKTASTQEKASAALVSSAISLPKTDVLLEAGRVNSPNLDNKLSVTQNFAFPGYYVNQRNFLKAESQLSTFQKESTTAQLAYQVRDVYLQLATLLAKRKLIDQQDSVYREVIKLEGLRFKVGETSRINLTSAEARSGMVFNQRRQLESQFRNLQTQWQVLLGSKEVLLPADDGPPKWYAAFKLDSSSLGNHPDVKQASQQVEISNWKLRVNRAKLWPDFNIGYINQSFAGPDINDLNRFLGRGDRFSSYLVGVNIPLFFGSYRSGIRSASFEKQAAETAVQAKRSEWNSLWQQAVNQYNQQLEALGYYENTAAKQASELIRTANLSFKNGDISYVEWASLFNQAIQLRTERIDAFLLINQTVNQLWFYQAQFPQP